MAASEDGDRRLMRVALGLARRGLGRTWPNPAVGCLLVEPESGRVLGRGWTQPGGRPHAETEALARAGARSRGATAYVTLEPCSHHGRTPPCTDALIAAGLGRVVTAVEDPDPRVAGSGHAALRAAGISVTTGVLAAEAASLNAGFFRRVTDGRPFVTLKLATTLDGRIATAAGESRWITGDAARTRGHLLRATHDAILIGAETARRDDPELNCRLPGLADRSPVRVVLEGRRSLPATLRLARNARALPTWLMKGQTTEGGEKQAAARADWQALGACVIAVAADGEGRPEIGAVLAALGARGITRLLVEGGGRTAAALLGNDLVDRLMWFRAPGVIGGDGVPVVAPYGLAALSDMRRFARRSVALLGPDVLETYDRWQ